MILVILGSQEMLWESQEFVDELGIEGKRISVVTEDLTKDSINATVADILDRIGLNQTMILVVEDIAAPVALILTAMMAAIPEILIDVQFLGNDGQFCSVRLMCEESISKLLSNVTS